MKEALAILAAGGTLSREQACGAFEAIMTGTAQPAQVGALLAMLAARPLSVDELVGAATVMRDKVTRVDVPAGLTVIDTCGTGGTHSKVFNISTSAAIVAAGAARPHGVAVAKHGNRSVTSRSGSAQVLEALGVKIRVQGPTLTRCLDEAGICFCFAQAHHPAMKHAMPIRLELGFRTIFNVLGPLTNPAGAMRQVMGVYDPSMTELIARVLGELGATRAMVVHGRSADGTVLGELLTSGQTRISEWHHGRATTRELQAEAFGLPQNELRAMEVEDSLQSAEVIGSVIVGHEGPARDIVCLNAAAALMVADLAETLADGLAQARESIDSGAAGRALSRLVAITQADPTPQS
jgi:anthranilate phosphoribosyltransferase